jgi:hypothetical protein
MMSIVPLLITDPSVPSAARSALRAAHLSSDRGIELREKARAARVLVDELGLSCAEAVELVDLPDDVRRGLGAA